MSLISDARRRLHAALIKSGTLSVTRKTVDGETRLVASFSDKSQRSSREIGLHVARAIGALDPVEALSGQTSGKNFEASVSDFVREVLGYLKPIRPGSWEVQCLGSARGAYHLAHFEPYTHLDELASAIRHDRTLETVLGNSYSISPDILVIRKPEPDSVINREFCVVDDMYGVHSVIRADGKNSTAHGIVHALISCKFSMRSDRAQNARSEALNVIRNRKGRTPHIAVVTAEPTPSRLASLALGTGDIDMMYHIALPELQNAVAQTGNDEALTMLNILVDGQRLRDISDLPLDLAV
ncbi:NgoMIV family type II restriction endonuclease [Corynebacterium sp. CCM 9203]|uniref:NgoMIV family type II restriction endonuclease n=1 Tax=Corynebacterium sp. CCM 9203 TaxID=3057615 RepID=UPI003525D67B